MTLLKRADSLMPITRSQVINATMTTASMLKMIGIPSRTGWLRCAWYATLRFRAQQAGAGFCRGPRRDLCRAVIRRHPCRDLDAEAEQ